MITRNKYRLVHESSTEHETLVRRSRLCGCFYCGAHFAPAEIVRWTYSWHPDIDAELCAICPQCGIDAVLPDDIPDAPLTDALLLDMHMLGFHSPAERQKVRRMTKTRRGQLTITWCIHGYMGCPAGDRPSASSPLVSSEVVAID